MVTLPFAPITAVLGLNKVTLRIRPHAGLLPGCGEQRGRGDGDGGGYRRDICFPHFVAPFIRGTGGQLRLYLSVVATRAALTVGCRRTT